MKMNGATFSNHFSGYFEIFAKFNSINAENFKFVKTQFYSKVIKNQTFETTSKISIQNRTYQRVSIPRFHHNTPKFQKKGIIFIWPQKRVYFQQKELVYVAWVASHVLYWLYQINILPTGGVYPIKQPPWNFEVILRKPEVRDYIIEPDWDSI